MTANVFRQFFSTQRFAGLDAAWTTTWVGVLATTLAAGAVAWGGPAWLALAIAPAPLLGLLVLSARRKQQHALNASWRDLQRRQEQWAQKLTRYQEWLEFPLDEEADQEDSPARWDARKRRAEADAQLEVLLQQATETIYEKIRTNEYSTQGRVDVELVRRDAWRLAEQVARLYHPELPEPLMQASPEKLFRAVQRVSLQLLVLMEELPLDVKSRSVQELYTYLRRAVSAYGVYQAATPYLPWLTRAYYLGRYAMGANPWSLGAWWVLGAIGKQGAQAAATRLFHRQALQWLYSAIRVVGMEAAGVYGDDYRHRDPDWIYAAEISDLISRLPLNANHLDLALKAVTGLPLRSEYDRLFLYRCLAARKSARPARFQAQQILTPKQRHLLGSRLDAFCESLRDADPGVLAKWRAAATERLDVQLAAIRTETDEPPTQAAARTLAGFLLDVKGCEPETLARWLPTTRTWQGLEETARAELLRTWTESPPFLVEFPSLHPADAASDVLLDDLATLAATVPPWDPAMEEAALSIAAYLKQDPQAYTQKLGSELVQALARRTATALPRKTTATVARALLNILQEDLQAYAVLHPVQVIWETASSVVRDAPASDGSAARLLLASDARLLWLVAYQQGLVVVETGPAPRAIWTAEFAEVQVEASKGWLGGRCEIRGGTWRIPLDATGSPRLLVQRSLADARKPWELLLHHLNAHRPH